MTRRSTIQVVWSAGLAPVFGTIVALFLVAVLPLFDRKEGPVPIGITGEPTVAARRDRQEAPRIAIGAAQGQQDEFERNFSKGESLSQAEKPVEIVIIDPRRRAWLARPESQGSPALGSGSGIKPETLAGRTPSQRPGIEPFMPVPPLPARSRRVPPEFGAIAPESLLHYAQFLKKAGLEPMANDTLRQLIEAAPSGPIAQEAQRELDSQSMIR